MESSLIMRSLLLSGVFIVFGTSAQAASLRSLDDLSQISIWERTFTGGPVQLFFNPDDSALTTKRSDPLSNANSDYTPQGSEFYDFFYSDADGSFNADGSYLTITAVFDNQSDASLNISSVWLLFVSGPDEYASEVTAFQAGPGASPSSGPNIGSIANALGNDLNTTTFLGNTFGQNPDFRLSLTLGFESTRVNPVPIPAAVWLFGTAILGLVGFSRRKAA